MMFALLLFIELIHVSYSFRRNVRIEEGVRRYIRPRYRNYSAPSESFNVLDYGAKGDGNTDNTAAFKAAFAAASTNGGGIVYAPPGGYLFDGQITIPKGVSLIGSYITVPSHSFPKSYPKDGTVLMPTYGKGETDAAHSFLTITEDATLKGVVIYYPGQPCTNAHPVVYSPSVYMNAQNAAIEDVELLNSYIGIWAVAAHRHYIARIQGQPISIGVFIDDTTDIGRMEDVHFNPWYCNNVDYMYTQTMYGRSFVMGRSDWEYVFNTFSFAYAIGYHFVKTSTGEMNGNFLGIGSDYSCNASIMVDASQPAGLLITNGEFTAFHNKDFAPHSTAVPAQVIVNNGNTGPVVMNSCSFWGPSNNVARLYGDSTTTFLGCQFVQWDLYNKNSGAAAVYANNGNVIVEGSEFQMDGTQIEAAKGVKKVIMSNNIVKNGVKNKIDSGAKSAISNNL